MECVCRVRLFREGARSDRSFGRYFSDAAAARGRPSPPARPPAVVQVVFAGIGVLLQRLLGMVMVVNMIESGPAHMSGLVKVGHCITEVRCESPAARGSARSMYRHAYAIYVCVYIYKTQCDRLYT